MILIRVICNFYDDYIHNRQLRRERLEWLKISRRFGLYKDLRILIGKKINRNREMNGDSYKILFLTILFVCMIAYGFSVILNIEEVKELILFSFKCEFPKRLQDHQLLNPLICWYNHIYSVFFS